jgi:hypothetical protein
VKLMVETRDLGSHLHAKICIEIAERLIEEKHLGLTDDRPAKGNSLPLSP